MAALYQTPDLPGGSGKRARFVFPTDASRIGPTNAADVPQSGVEPGIPEPDTDNVSADGVSLGVVGRLRQDATSDPTIEVRIEDRAATVGRGYTQADLESGAITIDQFLASREARARISVPRFSVRRTNYDQGDDTGFVGITSTWEASQEIDALPPDLAGTATIQLAPAWGKDRHGNLLLAYTVNIASDDGPVPYVAVYRRKPHVSLDFEHLLTIDIPTESGIGVDPVPPLGYDCDILERDGEVYVVVGVQYDGFGYASTRTDCQVYHLRGTDGDSPSVTYVSRGWQLPGLLQDLSVAHTTGGTLIAAASETTEQFQLGLSQDLRTWSDFDAGLVEFAEFRPTTLSLPGNGTRDGAGNYVTDIYAVSSTKLWACTAGGGILRSTDGGATWSDMVSPCEVDITAGVVERISVPLYSITAVSSTVIAVGADGCIVKSADDGDTWTVIRYARGNPEQAFATAEYDGTECAKTDIGDGILWKIRAISTSRAWIAASNGRIYYTANGGTTWTLVWDTKGRAPYVDFVVDDGASGNVMLAVGHVGVHDSEDVGVDESRTTRAVLLTDIETSSPTASYFLGDEDTETHITAITIERDDDNPKPNASGAIGYALALDGRVWRFDGDGSTVAFTQIADIQPDGYSYVDIHAPDQNTGGSTGDVVVASRAGTVYQATGANTGSSAQFIGQKFQVPQAVAEPKPTALWMTDVDKGVIGTTARMWQAKASTAKRNYAKLLTLSGGEVLLAVQASIADGESTKYWAEVYRAERPAPGTLPRFRFAGQIANPTGGAPDLVEYLDGSIVMSLGRTHRVSLDGGWTWRTFAHPSVPIGLGSQGTTADYVDATDAQSLRTTRRITEANGGELYSATVSEDTTKLGVYRAWHWDSAGTYYPPIVQGKPLSLGVDGLRVVFTGDPAPRDTWTIRPRYLYRASHLATDSPTAETWRSKDDDTQIEIKWDAQDAAVTDALGARKHWTGSFFGFFGSSFRQAIFLVSDPSNDGSFTAKTVTGLYDTAEATGPASALTSNVLKCTGKTWTPGQWAPGPRLFYVYFADQELAYRIVGNGTDWIEVDGAVDLSGDTDSRTFTIYGDRLAWDGTGGTGAGSSGLLGTDYQHMRIIQSTIPAQATPSGYFEAGRFFVGQEIPADSEARDFLYGAKFTPITNTEQDVSKGGVTSVRHYGRTGRLWQVQFAQETADAIGRKLGPLLDKMREPFVIVWTGDDLNTATLVQLVDATAVGNTLGNRFDSEWLLKEVV